MKQLIIDNKRFVISRERSETTEIISEDGEILHVQGFLDTVNIHRPVVPDMIPFINRPRSFLTDLRQRREVDLVKRMREKRRAAAMKMPKVPRPKKTSKKSLDIDHSAALASLPEAVRKMLMSKKG